MTTSTTRTRQGGRKVTEIDMTPGNDNGLRSPHSQISAEETAGCIRVRDELEEPDPEVDEYVCFGSIELDNPICTEPCRHRESCLRKAGLDGPIFIFDEKPEPETGRL